VLRSLSRCHRAKLARFRYVQRHPMPRFLTYRAASVALLLCASACTLTSRNPGGDSAQVAGRAPSVQHLDRLEWHRNVDDKGYILDTGDQQFTVLNSATVTDDALEILTGVGFAPGPEGERKLIAIPFRDIVEIKLITHPLSAVNLVIPLNAGTWGSRVLITTKDGSHEMLSIAKGNPKSPELYSANRGVFLPSDNGLKVVKVLWWPDRSKTRDLALLLEAKVAAYQER
jgi:hypothetical protein